MDVSASTIRDVEASAWAGGAQRLLTAALLATALLLATSGARGGAGVTVQRAARPPATKRPVRRIYDISRYLWPTGKADARRRTIPGTEVTVETPRPEEQAAGRGWAAFLRATIAPGTWQHSGNRKAGDAPSPYSITHSDGRLVVVHTEAVHKQIESWLASLAKARKLQVHILARLFSIEADALESLKLEFRPCALGTPTEWIHSALLARAKDPGRTTPAILRELARSENLRVRLAALNGKQVQALLHAMVKRRKGTLLMAPRLTCLNTQRACLPLWINRSYVRSISSDEEPEIGNVPGSPSCHVQPFVSADRSKITLGLRMSPFPPPSDRERERTTAQVRVPTVVTVANGGSLLVRHPSDAELDQALRRRSIPLRRPPAQPGVAKRPRCLIMLLTAEIVPDIFSEEE